MWYDLFAKILDRSVVASVVILAVFVVRAVLCRFPKKYLYLLWVIVALRLVCPMGVYSPVSLFHLVGEDAGKIVSNADLANKMQRTQGDGQQGIDTSSFDEKKATESAKSLSEAEGEKKEPGDVSGQDAENLNAENLFERYAAGSQNAENPLVRHGAIVWFLGMAAILLKNLFLTFRMKRHLEKAVRYQGNIYESDNIPSPFVMGILRPKIYIPFRLGEEEREYILKHEQYHIKRRDYLVKMFAFLLVVVYWFHPLVWGAYILMLRDMEMSCDEYVLQHVEKDIRKSYSQSLLGFAMNQRGMAAGLLAFGETGTRRRVKNVLNFKKYRKWMSSVALILVFLAGLVCLTDADAERRKNSTKNKFQFENPLIQDLKIKNGSSFQIDSYTISLEDGIYEENTQLGNLIFKVTNAKGAVEADIMSTNQLPSGSFGEDGRFTISIVGTHGRTIYAKYEGDILYISYEFEAKDYFYNHLNNSICLTDHKMRSESRELGKEYYFSLDTAENSKRIQMGKDGTIYISSLGFLVLSERNYRIDDMKIVLSDGTEKKIVDKENDIELGSWTTEGKSLFGCNRFFDEYIDCSKIDALICNGKSYQVSNGGEVDDIETDRQEDSWQNHLGELDEDAESYAEMVKQAYDENETLAISSTDNKYTVFVKKEERQKLYIYNAEKDELDQIDVTPDITIGMEIMELKWVAPDQVAVWSHVSPSMGCLDIYDVNSLQKLVEKYCANYALTRGIDTLIYTEPASRYGGREKILNIDDELLYQTEEHEVISSIANNDNGDIAMVVRTEDDYYETVSTDLVVLEKKGKKYKVKEKTALKEGDGDSIHWLTNKKISYSTGKEGGNTVKKIGK